MGRLETERAGVGATLLLAGKIFHESGSILFLLFWFDNILNKAQIGDHNYYYKVLNLNALSLTLNC